MDLLKAEGILFILFSTILTCKSYHLVYLSTVTLTSPNILVN